MFNKDFNYYLLPVFILIFALISELNGQPSVKINEIMALNASTISDGSQEFDDWIELGNPDSFAVNILGWYISDDKTILTKHQFVDNLTINGNGFSLFWADGQPHQGSKHLDFQLDGNGESLYLVLPDGETIIDSLHYSQQTPDISYGRYPDFSGPWGFLAEPTPGNANVYIDTSLISESPGVLPPGGLYAGDVRISVSNILPDMQIFYTLDGSIPTDSSTLFTDSLVISETSVLRMRAFQVNRKPSPIVTHTYIIDISFSLPVMSLATAPENLWGSDGIYDNPYRDIEKPIHIEFYDKQGSLGFSLDAGVKLHSPDMRRQKSLRLYAREKFGTKEIKYQIFPDKTIDRFKRLILRNGGNDGLEIDRSHIRDPLWHILYRQHNPEHGMASYLPVHVFLNGQYWGIYNLRERQDLYYIESNFNTTNIDFLERG